MRITLIRPRVDGNRWQIVPSMGLGYLSSALKRHGHQTILIDAWVENIDPLTAAYRASMLNPDVIGIQVFYNTHEWVKEFISNVKVLHVYRDTRPGIVVGGPHVSVLGLNEVMLLGADIGVVGESEEVLPDYLKYFTPEQGSQSVIRATGLIDVNKYPFPDWGMLNLPQYWPFMDSISVPNRGKRVAVIQRSRGCNYPCTFCAGHVVMGRTVRIRDTENVMQEIEYLRLLHNINEIWMQDDNTLQNMEKPVEFLEALSTLRLPVRFPVGIRTENINRDTVKLLKKVGVYFTGIGIESGSPHVVRDIKKLIQLDKVRDAISLLNSNGIATSGYFIIGLPTSTPDDEYRTLNYALSTKLSCAQFGIFNPLPGSEDGNKRPIIPEDELIRLQRNFTLRFYLQPRVLFRFLLHLRWSQIRSMFKHSWIRGWFGIKDKSRIV